MKKIKSILILTALLIIPLFIGSSCEPIEECDGHGTLSLTNKSHSTVQRIMINGVNYGTLDPGEHKDIELVPGVYSWQLVGISGGTGCSAATVTIVECETQGFSCSG